MREVGYQDLQGAIQYGEFSTENYETVLPRSNELYPVMAEFAEMIEEARHLPVERGGLPDAVGYVSVSQLQGGLMGVNLRINWNASEGSDQAFSSSLLVPVHENGYPEGGLGE